MKIKGSTLVVILLLILFPFVSWLYLKNGISFRKVALSELSEKKAFDLSVFHEIKQEDLLGKIILIDINGEEENTVNIFDQFKESSDFKIISESNNFHYSISKETMSTIKSVEGDKAYILIDNEGFKRNVYDNSMEDMKKAVIHIATLIPFVEKKKPRGIK
jgi:hypothetical protein